jgi:uncharacterized HAD superfamily protein
MKSGESKKKLGVDLDDVLLDFNANLCLYHNRMFGTNLSLEDISDWDLSKIWGCPGTEAVQRVFDFYESGEHKAAQPILGSQKGIRSLLDVYEIHLITSRPEFIEDMTKVWLHNYFPDVFAGIHFTNHFHGEDHKKRTKLEVCNELGIDIFIEDALIHALPLAEAGKKVVLFDRPWNRDVSHTNMMRATSWEEVIRHL